MEPRQQKPSSEVSLADATIRTVALHDGQLDITFSNNLRVKFRPTDWPVKRYLYVVEHLQYPSLPSNFVERIEGLLRSGHLGTAELVDPEK
jgi:hypothetical protein